MNPVELSLFSSRLAAICEEMGAVLGRSAFSPNIRDRLDYSCALFDAKGLLLGQATHIPVHLGSMAYAMGDLVENRQWQSGDMLLLNDPYQGGTHLPDVTLIAPIFCDDQLVAFAANRAHHADIGAEAPGSMPLSRHIREEGLLISPRLLIKQGELDSEWMEAILGSLRNQRISKGDFAAQIAANHAGISTCQALVGQFGMDQFISHCDALQDYAGRLARLSLAHLPEGCYSFTDYMDDDGCGGERIPITVTITINDSGIDVDFNGTAEQVTGNLNCPLSVTAAGVFYVFRCLLPDHIPACHGSMAGVNLKAPVGSLVNACSPAAVAAGNVETSSRIVDVLCGALAQAIPELIPAASQGSMNNVAMGASGDQGWDYYETLGGGAGASTDGPGQSGRQTHMTNTLNTPVEVLEMHYPLRMDCYTLRRGSGGRGQQTGGDGMVRSYRFLQPAEVSLLTERRSGKPWGLQGGDAGLSGRNLLDGKAVGGKCQFSVDKGQQLTIETPGGGGFGAIPVR